MDSKRFCLSVLPVLAAVLAVPRPALAQTAEPPRFRYEAPEGCPDADAFAASVKARGRTIVPGDGALSLRIARDHDEFVGKLSLEQTPSPREVRGAACREVADALAVVTVSTLGPEPKPAPPADPPSTVLARQPKELDVSGKLRFERDFTLSLDAGVMSGLVSGTVLPRYDFVFGLDNVMLTPDGKSYLVGSMVRVRGSLLGEVTRSYAAGSSTHVAGLSLGLELCAPLYDDRAGLGVFLCPQFSGGSLSLRTDTGGVTTESKQAGFGTGGLSFELAYHLGPVRVNAEVGGDAVVGQLVAQAPDGTQLSKSATVSGHALFGVGVTF